MTTALHHHMARLFTILALLLAPMLASGAPQDCTEICLEIDAVDDQCDDALGGADPICQANDHIADVMCGDEDEGDGDGDDDDGDDDDPRDEATCEEICAAIDDADDLCDDTLGESDPICLATDDIADIMCGDEDEDDDGDDDGDDDDEQTGGEPAMGELASCQIGAGGAAGGLTALGLVGLLLALRRR